MSAPVVMDRGVSLWLDALRAFAAIVVVLSHLAYPRFTRGDYIVLREWNVGSDAVILFFVLSGVVIAYAAERDATLGRFAFNRLTRLWSVLLPALVLTFAFDRVGVAIDPSAYPAAFHNPLPLWELLARGLSFTNEWAFPERLRLGTNGPLWSLSYEAAYYAMFAAAAFASGWRRAGALALVALLAGPQVLLLMPAWLMGVWLWRRLRGGAIARLAKGWALALALGAPLLYVLALAIELPRLLYLLTMIASAPVHPRAILFFSDEVVWNAIVGALATAHLIGMARLLHGHAGEWPSIRWLAGASFSIYVTHYPALHLLDAVLPEAAPGRDLALFAGSVAVGLVFAALIERRLGRLRAWLVATWHRPALPSAARAGAAGADRARRALGPGA
ncbi:MAG: acyltransferase family protein [Paracoccaceae bacterium]